MGLAGTVGETTLSIEQMPEHGHPYSKAATGRAYTGGSSSTLDKIVADNTGEMGSSQPHTHPLEGGTNQADSLPPFLSFEMVVRVA